MLQIEYKRTKSSFSDKIIFENSSYKVKRTTITKGFDDILRRWDLINTETKVLPLREIGLFKSLNQTVFVKRLGSDALLRPIELWLKVVRKISVKDPENNIYLTQSCGRIFQTDLTVTSPIPENSVPQGLRIEKISEEPLSKGELQKLSEDLNNPKCMIKPLIAEELQSGEIRLLV